MSRSRFRSKWIIAAVLVTAGALVGATAVWAHGAMANDEIKACYEHNGGYMYLPSSGSCSTGDKPLTWNTAGPAGPAGIAGTAGPAGPAGASAPDQSATIAALTKRIAALERGEIPDDKKDSALAVVEKRLIGVQKAVIGHVAALVDCSSKELLRPGAEPEDRLARVCYFPSSARLGLDNDNISITSSIYNDTLRP